MPRGEAAFVPELNEEYDIENALERAGLFDVHAPRVGTKAYIRLIEAAENYMREVRRMEQAKVVRGDDENYFAPKKSSSSSSDPIRREYHHQPTTMLLGKDRKGLPKKDADRVSDFAAILTGNEEYIGRW
jgi:hypothetical protein